MSGKLISETFFSVVIIAVAAFLFVAKNFAALS